MPLCQSCHSDAHELYRQRDAARAMLNRADAKLRPLVKDVPGALGRDIYELAAEEIIKLRAQVEQLKTEISQ